MLVLTRQISTTHWGLIKAWACFQATMFDGHRYRMYENDGAIVKKIQYCLCIGGLSNKRSSFAKHWLTSQLTFILSSTTIMYYGSKVGFPVDAGVDNIYTPSI